MKTVFQASEIEIVYKSRVDLNLRPHIGSSTDSFKTFLTAWDDNREYKESFYAMYLNRRGIVLAIKQIATGTSSGCLCEAKMIFQAALKLHASSIIVAHNHPSGKVDPSNKDINLTNKLKSGGEFLEIRVMDHIILGIDSTTYLSFADEGML